MRKLPPKVRMVLDESQPASELIGNFMYEAKRAGWGGLARATIYAELSKQDREGVLAILHRHVEPTGGDKNATDLS